MNSSDVLFLISTLFVSAIAGGVAAVSGFGIGSMLTPLLTLRMGTKLAVATVSVPHLVATAFRFWRMREHLDRRLLVSFGLMSAAGGLAGAVLGVWIDSPALGILFGCLLLFTGLMGLLGLSGKLRFGGWAAWLAGFVSGMLGGLVGNQGGIRSAAMIGFDVPRQAFVATATAVGLIVDGARMPVYLMNSGPHVAQQWPLLLASIAGTLLGTVLGERLLRQMPEAFYRRVIAILLLVLGVFMLIRSVSTG